MKTVTLTRDMRPWRERDDIHVPDDVATRLVASGEAENPRPFPPGASEEQTKRPILHAKPKTYVTKDKQNG